MMMTTTPDRSLSLCSKAQTTMDKKRQRCRISRIFFLIRCFIALTIFLFLYLVTSIHNHETQKTILLPLLNAERSSLSSSLPLTAYIESPLQPGIPLPRRSNQRLKKQVYPNIKSCLDIPDKLPVHHSVNQDQQFGPNVGPIKSIYEIREKYSEVCPVDEDPFLPWLHDVFLSHDYQYVEFVAHNKRRCRTDPASFDKDLHNLEAQVAIMQSVPVKRLSPQEFRRRIPDSKRTNETRFRLASLDEADHDARETRFICHFHGVQSGRKVFLGQTLSIFPYNYEDVHFRKGVKAPMLSRPQNPQDTNGAKNDHVWNAILHFRCPLPSDAMKIIQDGHSKSQEVVSDIYVDIVPIRTPPRDTREGYSIHRKSSSFDPNIEWGNEHVLPRVQDSGRWANIPIGCYPPANDVHGSQSFEKSEDASDRQNYLVGCLWASAAFTTRGPNSRLDTSTSVRLIEWLAFHLYIANLDHIYIYDNTEAHTSNTSLKRIIDLFPSNRVTRIPWKHRVCNNNFKGGERSSQYAAEASCRLRYGPATEWLVSFDTDEYLIAQQNFKDLKDLLRTSVKSGKISKDTHILSFYQTRASPRIDFVEAYFDGTDQCGTTATEAQCLAKRENVTFLQAYDCETSPLPKPNFGWRAQKQIYRPAYVLNHFVHYSMVTKRVHDAPGERIPPFLQRSPYERRIDELAEGFMLHSKTTPPQQTRGWKRDCSIITNDDKKSRCPIGIPWPVNVVSERKPVLNNDGFAYNCYQHDIIQNDIALRLSKLIEPLLKYHKR